MNLVGFVSHTAITMDYANELFTDYLDSIPYMLKSIEDAIESEVYGLFTRLEQFALDKDRGNCKKELPDIKKLFE